MKIKDLIIYCISVLVIGLVAFLLQTSFLEVETQPHYTLSNLYIFLGTFSIVLGVINYLLFQHFEQYIGIAFLAISSIKILFLVGIYKSIFFNETKIDKQILVHFLIPFFIYLLIEVYLSAKHLNKSVFKQKKI